MNPPISPGDSRIERNFSRHGLNRVPIHPDLESSRKGGINRTPRFHRETPYYHLLDIVAAERELCQKANVGAQFIEPVFHR